MPDPSADVTPFTKLRSRSVAALGEERLIASIRRWLGPASPRAPHGIGDDCAVLSPTRGRQLLTIDPVVFGRHFDDSTPARAVGEKLLKRNLSDIAAMGGRPVAAVIALTLDSRVSLSWLEGFYRGLAASARRHGVSVVGGDVAEADGVLAASLALLGRATGPRVLTRSGARTGDWIYVSGLLGASMASGHHWRFSPRLAEGAWLARRPSVRAMIDVSDGLAKDLHALAPRGAAPGIDARALPRRRGASLASALTEGEDYELAFALASQADRPAFERSWRESFPRVRLTCIGRFTPTGKMPAGGIRLADYKGYEHLRP